MLSAKYPINTLLLRKEMSRNSWDHRMCELPSPQFSAFYQCPSWSLVPQPDLNCPKPKWVFPSSIEWNYYFLWFELYVSTNSVLVHLLFLQPHHTACVNPKWVMDGGCMEIISFIFAEINWIQSKETQDVLQESQISHPSCRVWSSKRRISSQGNVQGGIHCRFSSMHFLHYHVWYICSS